MKHDHADIRYVDVLDQEGLRRHYGPDPTVNKDAIPHIDFSMTTDVGVLSLAQPVRAGAPFDWVVASHVIEHVPDVLGWLDDLAEVTTDGAAVVLMVPDRRFTFDIHRQQTTVGQLLEAHGMRPSSPSIRAVYDHFASAAKIEPAQAWPRSRPDR